jgi:hypothetical protein
VHLKAIAESSDLDEAAEAVKRWLSSAGNDNYDTPKLLGRREPGNFDIRPFLPEAYYGAVLIITRSSQLRLGPLVVVKKLQSIEHSLEILLHALGLDGLSSGRRASFLVLCRSC